MNTPTNESPQEQALRLAQLEIKLLRAQLLEALEEAKSARGAEEVPAPRMTPPPSADLPASSSLSGSTAANVHTVDFRPKNPTVLCVEDSEANFMLIKSILTDRPGVNLTWAENGGRGLALAEEHNPELVLLDLDLPDMHGSEVLRKLREQPATAETPVIVISADATPSQIERMLTAGARDYITKPFEIRRFLFLFDEIFPQAAVG